MYLWTTALSNTIRFILRLGHRVSALLCFIGTQQLNAFYPDCKKTTVKIKSVSVHEFTNSILKYTLNLPISNHLTPILKKGDEYLGLRAGLQNQHSLGYHILRSIRIGFDF